MVILFTNNKRPVLVTGASGFIAKHICLQLLNAGYRVRGSVRSPDRIQDVVNAIKPQLTTIHDLDRRLKFVVVDLNSDVGWDQALEGTGAVIHSASPVPLDPLPNEIEIVRPAVDGTLRVLRAASKATVKRVILTSSIVAIYFSKLDVGNQLFNEHYWTDLHDPAVTPYIKSKTLAERAAWNFAFDNPTAIDLTVINPGFVIGPPLDQNIGASIQLIRRLMYSRLPVVPNIGFAFVDVRDIAAMHVKCLSSPASIGMRILGAARFCWLVEIVGLLEKLYPRKVAIWTAPDWFARCLGFVDSSVSSILPRLGRSHPIDNSRATATLGIQFIDVKESVASTVNSLLAGKPSRARRWE